MWIPLSNHAFTEKPHLGTEGVPAAATLGTRTSSPATRGLPIPPVPTLGEQPVIHTGQRSPAAATLS